MQKSRILQSWVICKAAILLAAAIPVPTAQPSVANATVPFPHINGGPVSLLSSEEATGTSAGNGQNKTIGATSDPQGTVANMTDINAVRGTQVMSDDESDPTGPVPAPPMTTPPGSLGTAGACAITHCKTPDTATALFHTKCRRRGSTWGWRIESTSQICA